MCDLHQKLSSRLTVGLDEGVCAVCDNLVLSTNLHHFSVDELPINALRERLRPPINLPPSLVSFYTPSTPCKQLAGILLSSFGVFSHPPLLPECPRISICESCHSSLSNLKVHGPPKFAIANGNYMGILPEEFHDLSYTELAMTALAQNSVWLSVVKGGPHRNIRSHSYAFAAVPAAPASLLPVNITELGSFKVTIVSALTQQQFVAAARKYTVRLNFYRSNIPFYAHVQIRPAEDLPDSVIDTLDESNGPSKFDALSTALEDAGVCHDDPLANQPALIRSVQRLYWLKQSYFGSPHWVRRWRRQQTGPACGRTLCP